MKKRIIFLVVCIILLPITVNATGGGLRKNSLKTCPNGVTYGMHGDGNGGTHWHEAVTNGDNYYAKGDAIYSDPCPNSNTNEGTARNTNGGSNNGSSNNNGGTSSNTNGNNNSSNNTSTNKTQNTTTKPIEKNSDNTIKGLIIDSDNINISDEMNYETTKKNVEIKIELNDSKAKYDFENKELVNGENVFNIKVTAENESVKDYKLIITKKATKGTATIKKFVLGAGKIEFRDNKSTIKKLKNEDKLDYSYELSDSNATLKIYLNENETTELNNLKENDIIKLVVIDSDDNENVYEIKITNASIIYTFLVYGLTALFFLSPVIVMVVILLVKKKKKLKL